MKVVLFEGPDKVGKTTKVNDLLHRISLGEDEDFGDKYEAIKLNLPYEFSQTLSTKIAFEARTNRLRDTASVLTLMNEHYDDDVVCLIDRLHISEAVYGECLRNGEYDRTLYAAIDSALANDFDTTLITCVPTITSEWIDKFGMNGQIDDLSYEQYERSVSLFMKFHQRSRIKKKMLLSFDDLIDPIVNNWLAAMLEG